MSELGALAGLITSSFFSEGPFTVGAGLVGTVLVGASDFTGLGTSP